MFSDKHAAFERNGNMSLFEKFELAREVSEICDSVVPLIKVVIVEGGKWRDDYAGADDVMAAVQAAATGGHRSSCCSFDDCRDNGDGDELLRRTGGKTTGPLTAASTRQQSCGNPFGAIMEDDVDRMARGKNGRPTSSAAAKSIELKVYSRSVNYFREWVDDRHRSLRAGYVTERSSLHA